MSRLLIVVVVLVGLGGTAHLVNRRSRKRTAEVIAAARHTTVVVSVSPATASQLHQDHPEFSSLVTTRPGDGDAVAAVAHGPVAAADSQVANATDHQ